MASKRRPPHDVETELAARSPDRSGEEFQTVSAWLRADAAVHGPPRRQAGPAAVALGLEIYREFRDAFARFFCDGGPGIRRVRAVLRWRFGEAPERLADAVLDRLWDSRGRILDRFRRRAQRDLFGTRTFEPGGVGGYLLRVAENASWRADPPPVWNDHGAIASFPCPAAEEESPHSPARWLVPLVTAFWSEANGFPAGQRLEALTSLGLGSEAGHPQLARRCRDWLRGRLPAWDAERQRLEDALDRWLARARQLSVQARLAHDDRDRADREARLRAAEARVAATRGRLERHARRLLPRPSEVARLLRGILDATAGNVRHRRIDREVARLRGREGQGRTALAGQHGGELPAEVRGLLADVGKHVRSRPPSPGQHGLSEEERQKRRQDHDAWMTAGAELLARMAALSRRPPAGLSPACAEALCGWLADAEDFYEFGLLSHRGVTAGLCRRRGWRLERLLRPGTASTEG